MDISHRTRLDNSICTLEDYSVGYISNFFEQMFEEGKIVTDKYNNAFLNSYGNFITFNLSLTCDIALYSGDYYDGGGSMYETELTLQKLNPDTNEYENFSVITMQVDTYYILAENVTPGTYKLLGNKSYWAIAEVVFLLNEKFRNITIQNENGVVIERIAHKYGTPIQIEDFPFVQLNKVMIGYQDENGNFISNGTYIENDVHLTPVFVEYEPVTDSNGNVTAVKLKQDIYDLLKTAINKITISFDVEE